jgi:hypothetical protein
LAPEFRASARLSAVLTAILILALPARGWAWGFDTHRYIARNYSKHLPAQMFGLRAYDGVVETWVTHPDERRSSTPGEGPRHYIDVDWYPEFLAHEMPHQRSVLEAEYGAAQVEDIGIVPWAVDEEVALLTQQFQAGQWSNAAVTIADICHYVGDACQPLHCTLNYDGQLTGNDRIHSRYETTMMSSRIGLLNTPVMPVDYYPNVPDAMFSIVGGSWTGLPIVLEGDNVAKAAAGGSTSSTTYYNALWNHTQSLTRTRIDSATVVTASMVFTAWVRAGRPTIPGSPVAGVEDVAIAPRLDAGPTPFRDVLSVRFAGAGPLTVDVYDVRGARVAQLADGAAAGSVEWRPGSDVRPGLYFVRLATPERSVVRRVTRLE